ncbi:MAG: MBL fold metallo-hydrolase [Lachnospiraceae bacterium]|nr:MBL fold metallo-hydrolase [Lachnospiraceae bacterium]
MKITYLGHSGFLVETKEHYLLFDYYTGKLPAFLPEKKLTVFVSHSHQDHYNKEIFALQCGTGEENGRISYVLSKDIRRKQAEELVRKENTLLSVKAHEKYTLHEGQMTVETLRSTDVGVAYIVTVMENGGKSYRFYHAGDLNLWKWEGESRAYNNNMEANYRREMERLRGEHFDAAFVPLDPRLERFAFGGLDLFLETAEAKVVFPMHFWKQSGIIREYLKSRPQVKNLVVLKDEGRTCEF